MIFSKYYKNHLINNTIDQNITHRKHMNQKDFSDLWIEKIWISVDWNINNDYNIHFWSELIRAEFCGPLFIGFVHGWGRTANNRSVRANRSVLAQNSYKLINGRYWVDCFSCRWPFYLVHGWWAGFGSCRCNVIRFWMRCVLHARNPIVNLFLKQFLLSKLMIC